MVPLSGRSRPRRPTDKVSLPDLERRASLQKRMHRRQSLFEVREGVCSDERIGCLARPTMEA
jgi:hypothetical protein